MTPMNPESVNLFELIHTVKSDIRTNIDTALSWDKLNAPDINFTILRPLLRTYENEKNPAIIYALLLNRLQFLRLAKDDLAFKGLLESRAMCCELIAMKMTRIFAASDIELIGCLTRPWNPFQGAPESVLGKVDLEGIKEGKQNTLELAIISSSKYFLSTPLLQRVVALIHRGTVVYHTSFSFNSRRGLLDDGYMGRGRRSRIGLARDDAGDEAHTVYLYDVRASGWLDTARLKVPFWRDGIEIINFSLLFISFVLCIRNQDLNRMNWTEIVFILFGMGMALDEFAATKEHGFLFYSQSLFNGFDLSFLFIFFTYFSLRIHNLFFPHVHRPGEIETSKLAFDILACGAAVLFPRLAFTVIQGKVVLLALKKMMVDFVTFMALALACFTGIFYALITLGKETWTARSLAWLMAQIWFGSSYLSFSSSASFHPIFGPILLISYAALSNTLLVTILISILSNRYADISKNAREEQFFQGAVATVGGVKTDAIFSYIIPLNIPAALILGPLRFVVSSRSFHSLNVFFIRLSTFPLLLAISFYERSKVRRHHFSLEAKAESAMENIMGVFGRSKSDWVEDVFTTSPFSHQGNPPPDSVVLLSRSEDFQHEVSEEPAPVSSEPSNAEEPSDRQLPPATQTGLVKRKLARVKMDDPNVGSRSLTSPLAKLFNHSFTNQTNGASTRDDSSEGSVDALKLELKDLKKRQIRMEAMLLTLTEGKGK